MSDLFIDVSHHNADPPKAPINWPRVKAAGVTRAYIKATESNNFTDPRFSVHWAGAKAVGIQRGAYLFFRGNANGKSQAARFLMAVGADLGELPPAVDVEAGADGVTRATFTARLRECLQELERLTGRKPVIYTRATAWDTLTTRPSWVSEYRLWLAAPDAAVPPLPVGAATWWLHQYSWTGDVEGIGGDVDLNRENAPVPDPEPPDDHAAEIRAHAQAILGLV